MAAPYPASMPLPITILGILGYGLIFWSLLALGSRFGIAPADRGLISSGPLSPGAPSHVLGEIWLLRCCSGGNLVAAL